MRYLAGPEILRMLLNELNHAVASSFELRGSLSEIGKTSSGLAAFRRLHVANERRRNVVHREREEIIVVDGGPGRHAEGLQRREV